MLCQEGEGARVSFGLPVVEHSSTATGGRVSFGGAKGEGLLLNTRKGRPVVEQLRGREGGRPVVEHS